MMRTKLALAALCALCLAVAAGVPAVADKSDADAVDVSAYRDKMVVLHDGNGHYARVQPAAANVFDYQGAGDTATLVPQYTDPGAQFDDITSFPTLQRCPGAGAPALPDGSNPFLDGDNLAGVCDPSQLPPNPVP